MGRGRDFLGTYRAVRMIRAGQTCQIWEAIRDSDSARVALKVLQPELRKDKTEIAYLKHEFEVGKPLQHPDVIEIYDFVVDRDMPFLVMEYTGGKNLKMAAREDKLSFQQHLGEIIRQAAAGLQYFHEQGWVHRDVKPDNFIVSADNTDVKLIDFALAQRVKTGISKLFAGRSKVVAGTRSYMAPEQIRGLTLDPRADIYSFGCMLFEFLAGRPPFTGVSPEDLLQKHLRTPPPPVGTYNSNVTPEMNELVLMLMAKTPEKRPDTMADFLRSFLSLRIFRVQPRVSEAN